MAEQEPPRTPQLDAEAIGQTLQAPPTPVADVAFGAGEEFALRDGQTRLAVFPDSGVTRLTGQDIRVAIFRSAPPVVQGEEVLLAVGNRDETGSEATLSVAPTGSVIFTYVAEAPGSPQPAEPAATDVQVPEDPQRGEAARPAAPVTGDGAREHPAAPASDTKERREAEERARLSGRLGRDPSFYTTRTGKRVAKFPLAIAQTEGKTAWHDVLAFGDHADALKERSQAGQLGRGNAVDVVGYWHENQKPGKDGTLRPVRELYAVAVSRLAAPGSP